LVQLTPKEEKFWHLALDKAAPEGEFCAAAIKFFKSLRSCGVINLRKQRLRMFTENDAIPSYDA
jgi:hypothetical protein